MKRNEFLLLVTIIYKRKFGDLNCESFCQNKYLEAPTVYINVKAIVPLAIVTGCNR